MISSNESPRKVMCSNLSWHLVQKIGQAKVLLRDQLQMKTVGQNCVGINTLSLYFLLNL